MLSKPSVMQVSDKDTKQAELERLRSVLYRYCRSITNSTWDAEDLVQETCLRALPVMNGLQSHSNPTAYMLRIAKNLAVDRLRRKQIAKRALEGNIPALYFAEVDSIELENALGLLVKHLSPLQRTVFLLREVFQFRGVEIAKALNMKEGAVKAVLHRARAAIGKLKDDGLAEGLSLEIIDYDLLLAYTAAIRETNPDALIALAMAQNGQIDPVHAIGTALRYAEGGVRMRTDSGSVTMAYRSMAAA
ncbi:RNA polymerase sigma factor [Paenibacillus sp. sptzw28]|uniref:RNA polymerase sigma factor n=1 Tax=Paenibacillus sp. sptzw28 TaxID=715179 RepID=UPI001C6E17D3|nr:RNA polymerase sigma factor [Paenibacillus sp. sptzw28]QYR19987.1 RNA polymerase sigma factor [Paenibacillus sp. sptzw28]